MVRKRKGDGGNAARDPRNNLRAQASFENRFGKSKKPCTGFIHFDQPPISVSLFRQAKGNKSTGLQSRCDLCNRLYFSIIQKPIKRITAMAVWAHSTDEQSFFDTIPDSLRSGIESCLEFWVKNPCAVSGCTTKSYHSSYRLAASHLTSFWSGFERLPKDSSVVDPRSGLSHAAPTFMRDLQNWASASGELSSKVDIGEVWQWWCKLFDGDTASDSAERRFYEEEGIPEDTPRHPLTDFPWGAGNILETDQGHSVPGFNQVKSSARVLERGSRSDSRVYSYLVEGDRIAMMAFSKKCKEEGMSLGHSPAPLRWLGKDDPINGKAQKLDENIALRDSLYDLYREAIADSERVGRYVSWQIRETIIRLGQEKVAFEEFTQVVESQVEQYLDQLLKGVEQSGGMQLDEDLRKADPGQTEITYARRREKTVEWLKGRPAARKLKKS